MAAFDITINTGGTLAEARTTMRAALKQQLGHINTITGGKSPGDGSNPYTDSDIDAASDDMIVSGLGIVCSHFLQEASTARLKRDAADAARDAETGGDITVPTSLG